MPDSPLCWVGVYWSEAHIAMITEILQERSEDQRLPVEDQTLALDAMYALKGAQKVPAGQL